jgi:serine/threonine-protein kinase
MGTLKRHPMVFVGVGITVLFLGLGFFRTGFIDTLELKFYDMMMDLRGDPEGPSEVILVDIDDDSIEKLGRWPWPRSLIGKGIRKINAGEPKVIGLNFILNEPQDNTGLRELKDLKDLFTKSILKQAGAKGSMFLQAMSAPSRKRR